MLVSTAPYGLSHDDNDEDNSTNGNNNTNDDDSNENNMKLVMTSAVSARCVSFFCQAGLRWLFDNQTYHLRSNLPFVFVGL